MDAEQTDEAQPLYGELLSFKSINFRDLPFSIETLPKQAIYS